MQICADQENFQLLLNCSHSQDNLILQHMINLELILHEFYYFLDRKNSENRHPFKVL